MTAASTMQRSLIAGIAALSIVLSVAAAPSSASTIPDDAVVVSSTELGSGSFTMTVSNVGEDAIDVELAPPGDVSGVSVDTGSYGEYWTIDDLASGVTATMTGILLR